MEEQQGNSFFHRALIMTVCEPSGNYSFVCVLQFTYNSFFFCRMLSDLDNDGNLDINEFCIAFHLIRVKVKQPSIPIPAQLPAHLLPGNKRSLGSSPVPNLAYPLSGNAPKRPGDNDVQTLLTQSKALQADMFGMQQHIQQQGANAEDLKRQEAQIKEEIERTRLDLQKLRQEKNMIDASVSSQQARLEVLKQDKENFDKDAQTIKDEIVRLSEILKQGEDNRNQLEQTYGQSQAQIQSQIQELINLKEKIVDLKNQFDSIGNQKDDITKQTEGAKDELYALQEQKRQLHNDISNAESQLRSFQSKQAEYKKESDSIQLELQKLGKQKQDLDQKLADAKNDLALRGKKEGASSSGEKIKNMKLGQILKKIEEIFAEYNQTLNQDAHSFEAIAPKPQPPALATVALPQAPKLQSSSPTVAPVSKPVQPTASNGFGDFDFGASVTVAPQQQQPPVMPVAKTSSPSSVNVPKPEPPKELPAISQVPAVSATKPEITKPQQSAPAADFGFDAQFDDDFGNFDSPAPVISQPQPTSASIPKPEPPKELPKQPQPVPAATKPDTVKAQQPQTGDFGFGADDFGASTAFESFAANNTNVTQGGNFDWDFDNKPAAPATDGKQVQQNLFDDDFSF